eukprot:9650566-Lingulodinium_polyedra.AAC.1
MWLAMHCFARSSHSRQVGSLLLASCTGLRSCWVSSVCFARLTAVLVALHTPHRACGFARGIVACLYAQLLALLGIGVGLHTPHISLLGLGPLSSGCGHLHELSRH